MRGRYSASVLVADPSWPFSLSSVYGSMVVKSNTSALLYFGPDDKSAIDATHRGFRHTSPWRACKKHTKLLNELLDTLHSLLLGIFVKSQDLEAVSMEERDLIVHAIQFRVVSGTFEGFQILLNGVDSTPPA